MSFAVNTLSQFMVEPKRVHCIATKQILRYLAGIVDYGMDYRRSGGVESVGFTYSDWVVSASDRNNTFSYCFRFGLALCRGSSGRKVRCFEFCRG